MSSYSADVSGNTRDSSELPSFGKLVSSINWSQLARDMEDPELRSDATSPYRPEIVLITRMINHILPEISFKKRRIGATRSSASRPPKIRQVEDGAETIP
ncbi:hypothetical protein L1987_18034 [Smallanthus sonchifolius]|uniref:Uncharacterized protein n=1 Tax=Smallanthus sonchifolius TaxID=185202 RepID=A0ACB9IZ60_9ASTR|nr:hypothetical protein L1987_18034 [Smallanthus sonchifolius]